MTAVDRMYLLGRRLEELNRHFGDDPPEDEEDGIMVMGDLWYSMTPDEQSEVRKRSYMIDAEAGRWCVPYIPREDAT